MKMSIGAMIFLGVILVIFAALDIMMVVSLAKPGDERNQIIVWKASSFTLLSMVGANLLNVVYSFVRAQPLMQNSLIQLETTAILYFVILLYYKRRHGG